MVEVVDGSAAMPLGTPLKIVHNALMRTETERVPRDFQRFLDLVLRRRRNREAAGEEADDEMDPTQSALSGGLAVAVALRSGVPADAWLDDPRDLYTAVELLDEADREWKHYRGR